MNFYAEQLSSLNTEKLPLPAVKFKDCAGFKTTWMHLTPEGISEIQKYLSEFTPLPYIIPDKNEDIH